MIPLLMICAQIEAANAGDAREVIPDWKMHIVHIRDWHYVTKENFAADNGLEGDERDKE